MSGWRARSRRSGEMQLRRTTALCSVHFVFARRFIRVLISYVLPSPSHPAHAAPLNLEVPEYKFLSDTTVVLG